METIRQQEEDDDDRRWKFGRIRKAEKEGCGGG